MSSATAVAAKGPAARDASVRERPVLFSAPMVRAILDGTKTQTRRVVTDATSQGNWKPSQCDLTTAWVDPGPSPAGNAGPYLKAHVTKCWYDDGIVDRIYPRLWTGDWLWVRETWRTDRCWDARRPSSLPVFSHTPERPRVVFDADGDVQVGRYDAHGFTPGKARPSIHMPRWASRITLELTGVRVERVQDITHDDAIAEGAPDEDRGAPLVPYHSYAIANYRTLWDSLNAKRGYGWDANPWVWCLSFRRLAA